MAKQTGDEELDKILEDLGNRIKVIVDERTNQNNINQDFVDCPMEFEKLYAGNDKTILGLMFGDYQKLFFDDDDTGIWKVYYFNRVNKINTKIRTQPTPQDQLEIGKWYFLNLDLENKDNIENYKLYLGEDRTLSTDEYSIFNEVIFSEESYYEIVKDK